jgi:hypothetical protein
VQLLTGSASAHSAGYSRYVSSGVTDYWWYPVESSEPLFSPAPSFQRTTGHIYGRYNDPNNTAAMHGFAQVDGGFTPTSPGWFSIVTLHAISQCENGILQPYYLVGKNDENSSATVDFLVNTRQYFSLYGTAHATCDQVYFQSVSRAELRNIDTNEVILFAQRVESGNVNYDPPTIGPAAYSGRDLVWSFQDILPPGRYRLSAGTGTDTNIGFLCPDDRINGASAADTQLTMTFTACATIATHPASATVTACPASAVTFPVAASGTGPFTYQWQAELGAMPGTWVELSDHTGVNSVSGSQSAVLSITNIASNAAGRYRAIVTGACGSVISNPATLTVRDCCPADFNHSGALSVQDLFDFLTAYFAGC